MSLHRICCCTGIQRFRLRIRNSLQLSWTYNEVFGGQTDRDDVYTGTQILDVEGTSTGTGGATLQDFGSSITWQRTSFGVIRRTYGPFVDLNNTAPSGNLRTPAASRTSFPGLDFRTYGVNDPGLCLNLNQGDKYTFSNLVPIPDPGSFDNGSAGYTDTVYDFNGNPTGSTTRRGTPVWGYSPGLVQVRMVEFSRAYKVLNESPNDELDFITDLGVFDPVSTAYLISNINFNDTTILPQFSLTIDGNSFSRSDVQSRVPSLICALRTCMQIQLDYQLYEVLGGLPRVSTYSFTTIRNTEILDYQVL